MNQYESYCCILTTDAKADIGQKKIALSSAQIEIVNEGNLLFQLLIALIRELIRIRIWNYVNLIFLLSYIYVYHSIFKPPHEPQNLVQSFQTINLSMPGEFLFLKRWKWKVWES